MPLARICHRFAALRLDRQGSIPAPKSIPRILALNKRCFQSYFMYSCVNSIPVGSARRPNELCPVTLSPMETWQEESLRAARLRWT